jgi:transposase InsO family protein
MLIEARRTVMREGHITLSQKEIDRLRVIHRILDNRMNQVEASRVLCLSYRQVSRIKKRVRDFGDKAIRHSSRGRCAPNKFAKELEEEIGRIVENKYVDFGPTLASEKLGDLDGIKVGREKLRQIMITKGLWKVRKRRREDVHPWRERKAYFGEMIQFDGSHHMWLEERGPKMVFMGHIDDATNHIFGRFYSYEGVYPAMDSLERYIDRFGLPRSVYLDKHSTYKTTRRANLDEELRGEGPSTQYERALKELGIELIHAGSPQAKGRIERLFGTLQDRLVKEMRLAGVKTIEEANEFLDVYLPRHNKRFSKVALKEGDLHRPIPEGMDLQEILCLKDTRTINDGYLVRWKGRSFLIDNASLAMRRRKVEVREQFDGRITIKFKGRYLDFHEVFEPKSLKAVKLADSATVKKKGKYIPPPDHPWKRHDPALHHNCYLERI